MLLIHILGHFLPSPLPFSTYIGVPIFAFVHCWLWDSMVKEIYIDIIHC